MLGLPDLGTISVKVTKSLSNSTHPSTLQKQQTIQPKHDWEQNHERITASDYNRYENCSNKHILKGHEICHCAKGLDHGEESVDIMNIQSPKLCRPTDHCDTKTVNKTNECNESNGTSGKNGVPDNKEEGDINIETLNNSDSIAVAETIIDNKPKKDTDEIKTSATTSDEADARIQNSAYAANERVDYLSVIDSHSPKTREKANGINERILDHVDPAFENQMNEQSEAECSIWVDEKM